MGIGKAQQRRVQKLGRLQDSVTNQIFSNTLRGQDKYLQSIAQPMQDLQSLGTSLRRQSLSPFTATAQGQGFLDVIEGQSAQAQENLASQSDMLGLSDEAFLSGTQNIAKSESDRLRSLFDLGEQSKARARQGYGNILQNIMGQQAQGFNTGLQQAQFGFGQGRSLQQQTGQMASGIANTVISGATGVAAAVAGSDLRLKKNISKVGKSADGHNIYTFEYIDKDKFGHGLYRGVIAQELKPHGVKMYEDGYYRVNYNTIDVNFERVK